mgnify:CR=1 FL=1
MRALGFLFVVALLVSWQPWTPLLHQQGQINALQGQINALEQQRHALEQQAKALKSKDAIISLARRQYQLVQVGQQLIQIVPKARIVSSDFEASDPANDPLVAPAQALPFGQRALKGTENGDFWARLKTTLEFWR